LPESAHRESPQSHFTDQLPTLPQKEPKLARARSIPEWEEYDSEIARFTQKLSDQGIIRSAASADINALAGEKSSKPSNSPTENARTSEPEGHKRDEL
jgi:UDP-glucose:glycoprotein glucosyltransferase